MPTLPSGGGGQSPLMGHLVRRLSSRPVRLMEEELSGCQLDGYADIHASVEGGLLENVYV